MYKVYIVEDEHLERRALQMIINGQAPNVKIVGTAASGKDALKGIEETDPQIILMDINIPEINGIEVLRRVKKADPEKKVILITAFNEFDFAHQAIKAKVDDLLLKPIRPEQLIAAINQAIEGLQANTRSNIDEKMSEIIYAVVHKKYAQCRKAVQTYLDLLYDHYGFDLISIQKEVQILMKELQTVADDNGGYEIVSPLKSTSGHKHFARQFQNRYNLRVEIMKVIGKIFDHMKTNPDRKSSIEDILNYIDRNAANDISLEQVGEYANMSSYYLSKIFKKETGMNFVTYLTQQKIQIAKDMLINTDTPIINIALDLSYHEPNYFSKVFKKNVGITPTAFRRKYRNTGVSTEIAE
ncbi:MAG: response regulator [Eubacteriaceae bacterium]|jgi:two-component system response regulator YesN|uniref:Stage 0 sporulation protein A homolog n=1 Tax=Candidatus Pseudoramibacter fermentans TaxID=2594427 RepID=A0A6L5GPY8_9FIRM|nr:response regulator [Candidatus Pseudoramibacter fermentans]RRF92596.1 MAG: response regulator [Eubacteriaceae bacterium]